MEKLIFNTTKKTVKFISSEYAIENFDNVITVKCQPGYYEVIQEDVLLDKKYPVLRSPISNTLMIIEK